MEERDPIDLIKDQLNKIDSMTGLHDHHEQFKQWHQETRTLLEKVFGAKSVYCQNFFALKFKEVSVKAFASPEIDKLNATRFKRDLESAKTILHGAIKELTLDRTLFKKLQTTPNTVEFTPTGEYFISSGISEAERLKAIERAFEGKGLKPIYGIESIQRDEPLSQRIEQIRRSKIGIYDLSNTERTEGFFELGIALGLGKEAMILIKKGTFLPKMFYQLNPVEYEDLSDLTEKLKKK